MILRNTAGQVVTLGPLLDAAGAAQTSGAALFVAKDGADQGAGLGTLTHWRSGVWFYAPTQAETDCGQISLSLEKSGSTTVALTVLTTRLPVQTATDAAAGLPTSTGNAQASAREACRVSGTVWHVKAGSGSDANDGLSWGTAFATIAKAISVAASGDAIWLAAQTFSLGFGAVLNVPDGVSLIGAGTYLTTISSSSAQLSTNGAIVRPGSNARVADLTIKATANFTGTNYQAPLGCHGQSGTPQAAFQNAVFENLYLDGDTDNIYTLFVSSFTMRNCVLRSRFDCVFLAGSSCDIFDSDLEVSFELSTDGHGVVAASDCRVRVVRTSIRVAGSGFTGTVAGVDASTSSTGTVVLIDECEILTSGGGTVRDVNGGNFGSVVVRESVVDVAKVAGANVSYSYRPANVERWRQSQPNVLVSGLVDAALSASERASVAAAWGSSVVGNGRTRDYFLQGGMNKVSVPVGPTGTYTVYATDDTTVLYTGAFVRDATAGALTSMDPA